MTHLHQLNAELVLSTDRRFLNRDQATPELLDILGVEKEWAEHIRIFDQQDDLVLLHYVQSHPSPESSRVDDEIMAHIGHVRGVIINTDTNKIVCKSLPYTPEIVSNDIEKLETAFTDLTKIDFYNACEGTVLRVFWSDGWKISTHRKIDAYNSYWSGPTFGEMFEELSNFEFQDLDRDLCYVFLMSHSGNRLVYKITEPQIMVIAVFSQSEQRFLSSDEYGPSTARSPPGCIYPSLINIDSYEKLQQRVDDMEAAHSFNCAGMIAIRDHNNPQPVKVVNEAYRSIRDARGNEPSLRTRYLQLRGEPEFGTLVEWFDEPVHREVFDAAEDEIHALVRRLHKMYVNRFIGKDFSQLPKEEFVTLQRCHTWHTQNRAKNIVTAAKVRDYLNTTPHYYVLIMLNRQRKEAKATKDARTAKTDFDEIGKKLILRVLEPLKSALLTKKHGQHKTQDDPGLFELVKDNKYKQVKEYLMVIQPFVGLKQNLDLEKCDKDGYTILLWAVSFGYKRISKLLLNAGVDPFTKIINGDTALILAAKEGHKYCLQLLLDHNVDLNARGYKGYTALCWAAREGHKGCLKFLLEQGAATDIKNDDGNTALMLSVMRRQDDCSQLLENCG